MQISDGGNVMEVDGDREGHVHSRSLGEIEVEGGKTGLAFAYAITLNATANDVVLGLLNPTNSGRLFKATQVLIGTDTAGALRMSMATGTPAGGATTPASLRQGIEPAQPGTVHGGAAAVTGMTEGAKIAYVRLAANTTFPIDLRGVTLDEGDAIVAITAVSGNVYVSLFGYWVEK